MQCNTMKCNALHCNAMQYNAMQCKAMQWNAMQGWMMYWYGCHQEKKGFLIDINFSVDSAEGLKVVWGWIAENFPQNNFKAVTHNLQNLPFSAFKLSS